MIVAIYGFLVGELRILRSQMIQLTFILVCSLLGRGYRFLPRKVYQLPQFYDAGLLGGGFISDREWCAVRISV